MAPDFIKTDLNYILGCLCSKWRWYCGGPWPLWRQTHPTWCTGQPTVTSYMMWRPVVRLRQNSTHFFFSMPMSFWLHLHNSDAHLMIIMDFKLIKTDVCLKTLDRWVCSRYWPAIGPVGCRKGPHGDIDAPAIQWLVIASRCNCETFKIVNSWAFHHFGHLALEQTLDIWLVL